MTQTVPSDWFAMGWGRGGHGAARVLVHGRCACALLRLCTDAIGAVGRGAVLWRAHALRCAAQCHCVLRCPPRVRCWCARPCCSYSPIATTADAAAAGGDLKVRIIGARGLRGLDRLQHVYAKVGASGACGTCCLLAWYWLGRCVAGVNPAHLRVHAPSSHQRVCACRW